MAKNLAPKDLEKIHKLLQEMDDEMAEEEISHFAEIYWIPKVFHYNRLFDEDQPREYCLSFLQRVFLTLEYPSSSIIAEYISTFQTVVILLNLVSILASSERSLTHFPSSCSDPVCNNDPNYCPNQIICQPIYQPYFDKIDLACVIVFTIDFIIRLSLCSIMPTRLSGVIPWYWDDFEKENAKHEHRPVVKDPYYPPYEIFLRYLFSFQGLIDLVSIVPSYVYFGLNASSSQASTFRILRLVRIIRTARINSHGRLIVDLLARTAHASREAILILGFYLGIILMLFASVMYVIEGGVYTINNDYPSGAFLRPDGYGGKTYSPFDSIPTTIYYMVVTVTTTGYGDLYPTTIPGRAIGSICCLLGLIVTALPISIISTNFSTEYKNYLDRSKKFQKYQKDRKTLARNLDIPFTSRLRAAIKRLQRHHSKHPHKHDFKLSDIQSNVLKRDSKNSHSMVVDKTKINTSRLPDHLTRRHSQMAVEILCHSVESDTNIFKEKNDDIDKDVSAVTIELRNHNQNDSDDKYLSKVSKLSETKRIDEGDDSILQSNVNVKSFVSLQSQSQSDSNIHVENMSSTLSNSFMYTQTNIDTNTTSSKNRIYRPKDMTSRLGYDIIPGQGIDNYGNSDSNNNNNNNDNNNNNNVNNDRNSNINISSDSADIDLTPRNSEEIDFTIGDIMSIPDNILDKLHEDILRVLFRELRQSFQELQECSLDMSSYADEMKEITARIRKKIQKNRLNNKAMHIDVDTDYSSEVSALSKTELTVNDEKQPLLNRGKVDWNDIIRSSEEDV